MKFKVKTLPIVLLSAAMIFGSASCVSASESEGGLLSGIFSKAKEVWSELPEEDKEAITGGVQSALQSESVQGMIGDLMGKVPEAQRSIIESLISNYLGEGTDTDGDGVDDSFEAEMDDAVASALSVTHDDVLEQTGVDLPEIEPSSEDEMCIYGAAEVADGIWHASLFYSIEGGGISFDVMTNITDLDQALSLSELFADMTGWTDTQYHDMPARLLISSEDYVVVLLWYNEEEARSYSVFYSTAGELPDADGIAALADQYMG